jgi:hypothetical protein
MRYLPSLLLVGTLLLGASAFARDGYQGRPSACDMPPGPRLVTCQEWISTVKRPDTRTSCCGDGDAYITDDFEIVNGELYAIISLDYPTIIFPDDSDSTPPFAVNKGTKILIPPEKRNILPEDANRSGHGVVFLNPGNGAVLCYFFPPLI